MNRLLRHLVWFGPPQLGVLAANDANRSPERSELISPSDAWIAATVGHDKVARERILDEGFLATYATLGIFLLIAARIASAHTSLISFTIWSSIVHGQLVAVLALSNPAHVHHRHGDVAALFVVAVALARLCPEAISPGRASAA